MTREEAKPYIGELQMYAKSRGWDEEYLIACDIAINELEQETVSKESYDHEYFLRKELEIKIARLEQQEPVIDKIRSEIVELWRNEPCAIEGGCLDEILEIIDKHRAETEEE